MEVNFNNLRKKTCIAFDRLTRKLNSSINDNGDVEIPAEQIQAQMDELKQFIGSIAMCYNPNDPEMKDVFEEIYPGDKSMLDFNPDADE